MKKTFPLGRMTLRETDALDVNRERYAKIHELKRKHGKSSVNIGIYGYGGEYFYGLHLLLKGSGVYHEHGWAALRKWGTFSSPEECLEDAVKETLETARNGKERAMIERLFRDLSLEAAEEMDE